MLLTTGRYVYKTEDSLSDTESSEIRWVGIDPCTDRATILLVPREISKHSFPFRIYFM